MGMMRNVSPILSRKFGETKWIGMNAKVKGKKRNNNNNEDGRSRLCVYVAVGMWVRQCVCVSSQMCFPSPLVRLLNKFIEFSIATRVIRRCRKEFLTVVGAFALCADEIDGIWCTVLGRASLGWIFCAQCSMWCVQLEQFHAGIWRRERETSNGEIVIMLVRWAR